MSNGYNSEIKLEVGCNYLTRGGTYVEIYEYNPKSSACMRGYFHKHMPSGRTKRVWSIWCMDGRHQFIGESEYDIIKQVV